MATITNKVKDRLSAGIKQFQPVLASAKSRDVNESDTVTIVTDMLSNIFGFNKYSEVTSEHAIRGTFVDIAIRLDGSPILLIEVKAIGLQLKDAHVKQAVDYGANQGVEWIILTNGIVWSVYKISFGKPIGQELVLEIDFLKLNPKNLDDINNIFLLTKEGMQKSMLGDHQAKLSALSRYLIGATILGNPVLDLIRRELRRLTPDVKIDNEQIRKVLVHEVFKREVTEGDKAEDALRRIERASTHSLRKTKKKTLVDEIEKISEEKSTNDDESIAPDVQIRNVKF